MILHAEGIGHAALPLDPILERHSGQVALPVIGPGVIDAAEILGVAALLECDQGATMRTAVFKAIELTVRIPRDDEIVVCITGNGLKTQEAVADCLERPAVIGPALEEFEPLLLEGTAQAVLV